MRFPLKEYLRDPVDEAALHRMALRIEAGTQGGAPRPLARRIITGTAATVVIAAAAAVLLAVSRAHREPGPLLLSDGRELAPVDATDSPKDVLLSDGSHIRLSAGAHLEPLESSGRVFWALVAQGHADFEVKPGGPRHWVIECGLATVEVVGTAFSCDREAGRLRIAVDHGVVLVRGERVPDRARRLTTGEILDLGDEPAPPAAPSARAAASATEAGDPQMAATEGDARPGEPGLEPRGVGMRGWRELARSGRPREAFATLGLEGLRRESKRLGVNDLLALADVARLSGHPAEAVAPLERVLAEFSGDPHAPLAAFALGRLELDSLGRAQAAASAFRKALALGIPQTLREDARSRLVEAYARGGDAEAAERAARSYFEEFPSGSHAVAVRGWLHPR